MSHEYLEELEQTLNFLDFPIIDGTYTRHLIQKTIDFEVYVITWAAGAETPFHGHPDDGCWMRIVSGKLREQTPNTDRIFTVGDTGFQKGIDGVHKIIALTDSKSLHLYKPQLVRFLSTI